MLKVAVGSPNTLYGLPDSKEHDCYLCGRRILLGKVFSDRVDRGEMIPCCPKCSRGILGDTAPCIADETIAELEKCLRIKLTPEQTERLKAFMLHRFLEGEP